MAVATADTTGSLLEREDSLSVLADALASVRSSATGRLVLVGGEAGAGKTALLRSFCASLNVPLLWGNCEPLLAPRPLGALFDVAAALGGELEDLVTSGARAHEVAAALAVELRERGPTVLVLEDLHWADEATLDVVRLLGRRVAAIPTLVLASYRDDELESAPELQVVLGDLVGVGPTRLRVSLLSQAAVVELAQAHEVDAGELYRTTGGNPFFVTEVLSAGGEQLPGNVREAVLARAARLSEADRRLLQTVAVVPGQVEMWVLEALAGDLAGGLKGCLASGMLRPGSAHVAFRHELARQAIEESLTPDRRVALNRRALAALARPPSGPPDVARLAHHAEAAGDGDSVVRFAVAAAEQASAAGARREAERQYSRALRFAGRLDPSTRADLLEAFARECYLTDMREEALLALDEALAIRREGGDQVRLAENQRLRARQLVCVYRKPEAWRSAVEAVEILEALPPDAPLARAYALLADLAAEADDLEEAVRWGHRALALAERVGDPEVLAAALNGLGLAELSRGAPEGHAKLERAVAVASAAGAELEAGQAYVYLVVAYSRRRDWERVDHYVAAGIEYCREHGLEAWLAILVSGRAESELARGRWDDAARTAMSILDAPRDFVISPRFGALLVLALVRARRGDPDYRPLLEEAREIARGYGDLEYFVPLATACAEVAWLEGRPEGIAEATDEAFALALELGEPSFLGELALWRTRAGLLGEAPQDVEAVYSLQLSGEWERAWQLWLERGCVYESALAAAESGDEDAVRHALAELQALGARPAAAIVARALRTGGARGLPRGPYTRTRANPAGLTPRELQVVLLLAEGLRNAEIAERLVVSEKTVHHHVSAIFRKLGVRTRAEAAVAAVRLGIVRHGDNPA